MKSDLRVVIDTGIIVGSLLVSRSLPKRSLDVVLSRGLLLESEETISELDDVLRRQKFNRYISEDDRLNFLSTLIEEVEIVEVFRNIIACRDPKDDKFLSLAVCGEATHVISGDGDLLSLNPFQGIPILTPRMFLDYLNSL